LGGAAAAADRNLELRAKTMPGFKELTPYQILDKKEAAGKSGGQKDSRSAETSFRLYRPYYDKAMEIVASSEWAKQMKPIQAVREKIATAEESATTSGSVPDLKAKEQMLLQEFEQWKKEAEKVALAQMFDRIPPPEEGKALNVLANNTLVDQSNTSNFLQRLLTVRGDDEWNKAQDDGGKKWNEHQTFLQEHMKAAQERAAQKAQRPRANEAKTNTLGGGGKRKRKTRRRRKTKRRHREKKKTRRKRRERRRRTKKKAPRRRRRRTRRGGSQATMQAKAEAGITLLLNAMKGQNGGHRRTRRKHR